MKSINLPKNDNAQPHYVYDLSIPLPERNLKRMWFDSAWSAALFLGVPAQRIYMSRSSKHRIWSESQGGWFAVRIAKKEFV